jgi:hypothetical protein
VSVSPEVERAYAQADLLKQNGIHAMVVAEDRRCNGCGGLVSYQVPGGLRCVRCWWPPGGPEWLKQKVEVSSRNTGEENRHSNGEHNDDEPGGR